MSKSSCRGLCMVVLATVLAGCGGGGASPTAAPAAGPTAVDDASGTAAVTFAIVTPAPRDDHRLVGVRYVKSDGIDGVRFEARETAGRPFEFESGVGDLDGGGGSIIRGRVGRFDYPTARLRAVGCQGLDCVTSNELSLEAALAASAERLTPGDDVPAATAFGTRTSLSSDGFTLAALGEGDRSGNAAEPGEGSVLLFRRGRFDGVWRREARIARFDRRVAFGPAIALSGFGQVLAVGAPTNGGTTGGVGAPEVGYPGPVPAAGDLSGGVYLYRRDADSGEWTFQAYLKAPDPIDGERFGTHVAMDYDGVGLTVASTGRLFTFGFMPDGTWQLTSTLPLPPRTTVLSLARQWVGPWLAASLVRVDEAGAVVAREVRLWKRCYNCAQDFVEKATLTADPQRGDPSANPFDDHFGDGGRGDSGKVIAFGGRSNVLVVGAPHDTTNPANPAAARQGSVYVFRVDAQDQWRREARLRTRSLRGFDYVGLQLSVSDDGGTIAAKACGGAANDPELRRSFRAGDTVGPTGAGSGPDCSSDVNTAWAGAVYLFERCDDGSWTHAAAWIPEPGRQSDFNAGSLAMSSDVQTLIYGVRLDDEPVSPWRVVVY